MPLVQRGMSGCLSNKHTRSRHPHLVVLGGQLRVAADVPAGGREGRARATWRGGGQQRMPQVPPSPSSFSPAHLPVSSTAASRTNTLSSDSAPRMPSWRPSKGNKQRDMIGAKAHGCAPCTSAATLALNVMFVTPVGVHRAGVRVCRAASRTCTSGSASTRTSASMAAPSSLMACAAHCCSKKNIRRYERPRQLQGRWLGVSSHTQHIGMGPRAAREPRRPGVRASPLPARRRPAHPGGCARLRPRPPASAAWSRGRCGRASEGPATSAEQGRGTGKDARLRPLRGGPSCCCAFPRPCPRLTGPARCAPPASGPRPRPTGG
jgi:hypothetical protein